MEGCVTGVRLALERWQQIEKEDIWGRAGTHLVNRSAVIARSNSVSIICVGTCFRSRTWAPIAAQMIGFGMTLY
jgi:hypothetical protein